MGFYVVPLMTDIYWFDNNPNTQMTEDQLPLFRQIRYLENQFFVRFQDIKDPSETDIPPISHFKKGLIISIILHYFLFWLIFSIIRTMRTPPGSPSSDSAWATKIENRVTLFHDREKEIVRRFVKLEKVLNQKHRFKTEVDSDNSKDPTMIRTYSLPTVQKHTTDSPLIGVITENQDEEEDKNDHNELFQGRQGVHSEKNSWFFSGSEEESPELNAKDQEEINETALGRIMKWGIFRYCRHCKGFKPLRTHHCQQCMKCVLKMDHHCQWLLTCIGLRNYKYFMNMLVYANFSLIFLVIIFSRCVADVALNPYIDGITIYLILLNYVLTIVMLGLVFGFTSFHFWLILTGKTTLEYCEKDKKNKEKQKPDEKNESFRNLKYDEGCYTNFVAVFNRNPFLWFFPVNRNEEQDGLFEKFENVYMEGLDSKNEGK